jgi:Peptidoglycan-binding protein, CsiV
MLKFRLTGIVVAALLAPLTAAQLAPGIDAPAPESPAEAPPEYQIEVIVFAHRDFNPSEEDFEHEREAIATTPSPAPGEAPENLSPDGLDSGFAVPELADPLGEGNPLERGSAPATTEAPGTTEEPVETTAAPFHFRLLTPEEFELDGIYATLERLSAYTPLLHGGWVQPGLPEDQARAFDLSLLGTVNPRGSIELYVSRFLHLNVDLSYQAQSVGEQYGWHGTDPSSLGAFSLAPRYNLHAERRLRSGEVHYFDHPAFGVLVQIRPSPPSQPEERAEPAA